MIANDLVCEAGTNNEEDPVYVDYATDPVAVEFGTPTIQKLVHDQTFNWWDNYPPCPQPYEHWSDDISYGPEGYMGTHHLPVRGERRPQLQMRTLTLEERVRNAASSQEVENVKAEHAYYHGRADATGEWGNIWSRSDECSWARLRPDAGL